MKFRCRFLALAALGIVTASATAMPATPPTSPALYVIRTETGMPNLENNLRYAVVTEQRCLDPGDLSGAFWMTGHVALQDCALVKTDQTDDAASYALSCSGGHGTTGQATWQIGADALTGTLHVRLGGKNMTFFQRITATPLGECRKEPEESR